MPDLFQLIKNWGRQILFIVLLSLVITAAIVFLQPGEYLAASTALPANPAVADKSAVFNSNLQELYSSLGDPDDADKLVGTGQLDTVYLSVCDQFNLAEHYRLKEQGAAARLRAAELLRKNSRVQKTEYGELRVKIWDKDRELAPQLANAFMDKLAAIHQDIQSESNRSIVKSLQVAEAKLKTGIDSANFLFNLADNGGVYRERALLLTEQLSQYQKLESQYQLMIDANPASLIVVEKARISRRPDRPRPALTLVAAGIAALLFGLLLALLLERRKMQLK